MIYIYIYRKWKKGEKIMIKRTRENGKIKKSGEEREKKKYFLF